MNTNRTFFVTTVMAFGFAFLYVPIVSLIVYSFNASKLVTVWGGFSTKWYGELLRDDQILHKEVRVPSDLGIISCRQAGGSVRTGPTAT